MTHWNSRRPEEKGKHRSAQGCCPWRTAVIAISVEREPFCSKSRWVFWAFWRWGLGDGRSQGEAQPPWQISMWQHIRCPHWTARSRRWLRSRRVRLSSQHVFLSRSWGDCKFKPNKTPLRRFARWFTSNCQTCPRSAWLITGGKHRYELLDLSVDPKAGDLLLNKAFAGAALPVLPPSLGSCSRCLPSVTASFDAGPKKHSSVPQKEPRKNKGAGGHASLPLATLP